MAINRNIVCLLSLVDDVEKFNQLISNALKIETIDIFTDDCKYNKRSLKKNDFNNNKKKKTNETAGLEQCLKVGNGSRVMLRRNLNMEKRLVNGALGIFTKIIKNEFNFVCGIEILFDNQKKPTGIDRFAAQFEIDKNVYITRQKFPINLAWAFTIHKPQEVS